jgi:hypothetical protein
VSEFVIALTAAVGSLLTSFVALLRYLHERAPRQPSPEPPRMDPPEPAGRSGGQPGGASGGAAARSEQAAPQSWSGAVRVAATRLPPAARRTEPAWWMPQTVEPSNDWHGQVPQPAVRSSGAQTPPPAGRRTSWWRQGQLRRSPQGARERSST